MTFVPPDESKAGVDYAGDENADPAPERKAIHSLSKPRVMQHTLVSRVSGEVHVRQFDASQPIDGTLHEVWLNPGETCVIHHVER